MLPNATVSTLTNGLTLVQIPMASSASVTVLVLAKTGSRYETAGQEGIAHFLEHMVFKGTAQFEDAQALAAQVDAVGADFNAFTSKEYTGYYVKADASHVSMALDVVTDMLLTPKLRQADVDRERQVIVEEINMYEDTPARHVGDVFERLMYANSGLEHDVIGSKQTVNAMKAADFENFLSQWYGPSNLVLVVSGAAERVMQTDLKTEIERFFAKVPHLERRKVSSDVHQAVWGEAKVTPGRQIKLETKQTEQAHFVLGLTGLHRKDPDRYALSVLSTILGGNMSSRLFVEVREKRGLCYYVHSEVDLYHDAGCFGASAGVDPQRIVEALQVITDEFASLVDGTKPVTADELKRAQDYIQGKTILGLEDSESVAHYFGMKQLLQGEIESPEAVLAKIKAVTLADLERVAKRLITNEWKLAVIGPYQDTAQFEAVFAAKKSAGNSSNK